MSETNINAYKLELVTAERDLDTAKTRVQALKDYIETVEPSKKSKKNDEKKADAEETIKATDTKNETRPITEDSISELPDEGEKIEVKTPNKKGK